MVPTSIRRRNNAVHIEALGGSILQLTFVGELEERDGACLAALLDGFLGTVRRRWSLACDLAALRSWTPAVRRALTDVLRRHRQQIGTVLVLAEDAAVRSDIAQLCRLPSELLCFHNRACFRFAVDSLDEGEARDAA